MCRSAIRGLGSGPGVVRVVHSIRSAVGAYVLVFSVKAFPGMLPLIFVYIACSVCGVWGYLLVLLFRPVGLATVRLFVFEVPPWFVEGVGVPL